MIPELRAPPRRRRRRSGSGLTGGRIGLAFVVAAAAWIGLDLRYRQILQAGQSRAMAAEFESALKQEIHESNLRRFELADYLRNATER